MYTAVVKFDTLTDTVWSAAQNHNFLFLIAYRTFIFYMVSGIIVSTVFCSAYMYTFQCFQ